MRLRSLRTAALRCRGAALPEWPLSSGLAGATGSACQRKALAANRGRSGHCPHTALASWTTRFADSNHPAVAPLNCPGASLDGNYPAIAPLNGSRAGRYFNHTAIFALHGARASPDGDHVAIFTLNAARTIRNGDADPVGACKFAWHAIAPVHTCNDDNAEPLSFHIAQRLWLMTGVVRGRCC